MTTGITPPIGQGSLRGGVVVKALVTLNTSLFVSTQNISLPGDNILLLNSSQFHQLTNLLRQPRQHNYSHSESQAASKKQEAGSQETHKAGSTGNMEEQNMLVNSSQLHQLTNLLRQPRQHNYSHSESQAASKKQEAGSQETHKAGSTGNMEEQNMLVNSSQLHQLTNLLRQPRQHNYSHSDHPNEEHKSPNQQLLPST